MKKETEQYAIYLRKSRVDWESELHGEGETLARHETTLFALAERYHLTITSIYREIVSGETIAARPEIQKLLKEVAAGKWAGVLVMETERLARGDASDQGAIAKAFKCGNCKIITPTKIYNPNDEFDEEYFEFELFMSRREYKTISRRLQRGRIASVNEGKFVGSTAPFGYKKVKLKNDKGYTLEIIPEKAEVIRLIFSLYYRGELQANGLYHRFGMYRIAKKLDELHIEPAIGKQWSPSTIKDILQNPTYIGLCTWQRYICDKLHTTPFHDCRIKNNDYIQVAATWEPIIKKEIFEQVQSIIEHNYQSPIVSNKVLKNPLSQLVRCQKCGSLMTRVITKSKNSYPSLLCPNRTCDNISAPLELIENQILEALRSWIENYKLLWNNETSIVDFSEYDYKKIAIHQLEIKLTTLQHQLYNTHNLLEQGIYSNEVFLSRNQQLSNEIKKVKLSLEKMKINYSADIEKNHKRTNFIPKIENILDIYKNIKEPSIRNDILKEILDCVTYLKKERNTKGNRYNANFELTLYPKIPKK